MIKKTRFFWTTVLAFLIILIALIISVNIPSGYYKLRIGLGICCFILSLIIFDRLRTKKSTKKATVTLIEKEKGGKTWYGISINGSKPEDDDWFIADGRVTIRDVICDKSRISYRIFIYHKDGRLKTVIEKRHDLVSV